MYTILVISRDSEVERLMSKAKGFQASKQGEERGKVRERHQHQRKGRIQFTQTPRAPRLRHLLDGESDSWPWPLLPSNRYPHTRRTTRNRKQGNLHGGTREVRGQSEVEEVKMKWTRPQEVSLRYRPSRNEANQEKMGGRDSRGMDTGQLRACGCVAVGAVRDEAVSTIGSGSSGMSVECKGLLEQDSGRRGMRRSKDQGETQKVEIILRVGLGGKGFWSARGKGMNGNGLPGTQGPDCAN
ncbi:hypothetical protein BDN72DRAFT_863573 [Pluteus cervinus]|uniref:Uncharacterized protein n=1 Tax=Pluteus cervinus TaxID=181527 RepID=A0ACD3A9I3_9AGAR|nr:hypothetical protein BDN72DRAFT_863573 [Pluteus cervinus]